MHKYILRMRENTYVYKYIVYLCVCFEYLLWLELYLVIVERAKKKIGMIYESILNQIENNSLQWFAKESQNIVKIIYFFYKRKSFMQISSVIREWLKDIYYKIK